MLPIKIGIAAFASEVEIVSKLDTPMPTTLERLTGISYDPDTPMTGKALSFVASNMFIAAQGHRPNVQKFTLVITNGKSSDIVTNGANELKKLSDNVSNNYY